ncbi:MAG: VIT1/CCC1 transporter family protein [Anaerolineales bacterium]|jgi:VIT1/CCC1 family predicted Fe2+/Mn2+ transporter
MANTSISHREEHFQASDTVRDIVIGMSDGLTVPFALAAGLSGVGASGTIVVTGGLAEIAAGSIAMGLGGYLAGRTDAEHYDVERQREAREVEEIPQAEREEVAAILNEYGLNAQSTQVVLDAFEREPERWIDFMMRFELGLEKPKPARALQSGGTIALAYIFGGLIPLLPYILIPDVNQALPFSVAFTLFALLLFGYIKGRMTGVNAFQSSVQTGLVGGLAAGAAYLLARWIG